MKKLNKRLPIRFLFYFIGLFIMTAGVALSVKSNLGVSPVSSIPYTVTCIFGIEMGNATILFHIVLVFLQMLILRKQFRWISLLQIPVGIVFGKFTTLCNALAAMLPGTDNMLIRLCMLLGSIVLIAIGIFFYMPANIMPLAGEGAMGAVSQVTGIEFSKVKIAFDCSMVTISLVSCLAVLHSLGSVGLGTVIAAVLVGVVLGIFNRAFGKARDRLFHGPEPEEEDLC